MNQSHLATTTERHTSEVEIAHKPFSTVRVKRHIASTDRAILQSTVLNLATSDGSLQRIATLEDSEISKAYLIAIASPDIRQPKVARAHSFRRDLHLVVATIVSFLPLQLFVVTNKQRGLVVCLSDGRFGSEGGVGRDGCAGKLGSKCAGTGGWVVIFGTEPDEVGDPVQVRVTGHHDVVADVVVNKGLERAVLVGHVAIPGITVIRVLFCAEPGGDIDAGEHNLATDEAPSSATLSRSLQLAIEPVLLVGAHEGSSSIVRDFGHVILQTNVSSCHSYSNDQAGDEVQKMKGLHIRHSSSA